MLSGIKFDYLKTLRTLGKIVNRYFYFATLVVSCIFILSCKKETIPTIHVQTVYTSNGITLNSICVVNSSLAYAGGNFNLLLKSTDGGDNWNILNAPAGNNSTSVIFFADEKQGFISTDHNYYFTDNGGSSWDVEDSNTIKYLFNKYNRIHPRTDRFFIDSLNGWQYRYSDIRYYGYISSTHDGGKHWQMYNTNQHNHITDVAFANEQFGFAVGQNTILASTDGGANWEALRNQDGISPPVYVAVGVRDASTAFAIHDGSIDKIYR